MIMGAGLAAALLAAAPAPPASCPAPAAFPMDIAVVKVVRVVKGSDGESHFVPATLTAAGRDYFGGGKMFFQLDLGAASQVRLVQGPANTVLPAHASLGYEAFLTVAGNSFVTLADGSERELSPGVLAVMEDMGSKTGHAGRTGPCGYLALQVVVTKPLF